MECVVSGAWAKLIGLVLRLVSMLGIYGKGRSDARTKAKIKGLKAEVNAHEAKDEVDEMDRSTVTKHLSGWVRPSHRK